uniref:Uncharacterized protein n=1 Tax=Sinocyclocheilus anshuiensis TaxID=1608454 RepID=A0A671KH32_9TELE
MPFVALHHLFALAILFTLKCSHLHLQKISFDNLTVYLGKRDFVDHLDHVDPVDGVILVEPEYLKDRKVDILKISHYIT